MGVVLQFPSEKIRSHSSSLPVEFEFRLLHLHRRAGSRPRPPRTPAKRPAASLLMMTAPVVSPIAVNARNMP
jgi:hypothetical protein